MSPRCQGQLVKFKINNVCHTISNDFSVEVSLNEYLRNYSIAKLKGTKLMCMEGGCGVCIVAVERSNPVTNEKEIFAVNSCLVSIFSCHGWNVITIEGLGNKKDGYHKVQTTLAAFNGTQCGYCSPGMIMNMYSLLKGKDEVKMSDVENSFGGNICRCTGYRSILDAFKSLAKDATPELKKKSADIEDIVTCQKRCSKTLLPCYTSCQRNGNDENYQEMTYTSLTIELPTCKWFTVTKLREIYDIFETMQTQTKYSLVSGNTARGLYPPEEQEIYIDISNVGELQNYEINSQDVILGGNLSLTKTLNLIRKFSAENPRKFGYFEQFATHIELIANVPIRNIATLAGNLATKHAHREFSSDLFLLLEAIGAELNIGDWKGKVHRCPIQKYLTMDMHRKIILNIILPALDSRCYVLNSYKIMPRAQNTGAYVNAAFLVKTSGNDKVFDSLSLVYGGINSTFVHASKTEDFLKNKNLYDSAILQQAFEVLKSEVEPDCNPVKASPEYRKSLAVNLFYRFVLSLCSKSVLKKYQSGGNILERPLSSGKQHFITNQQMWPITKPMLKVEAFSQCAGEAEYVNDISISANDLYGALVISKIGPGKLINIDTSCIENINGVVDFVSAKDIPGKNAYSGGHCDSEELFADREVLYAGQPVGVIIATSQMLANKAADKIIVNVEQTRKPLLDIKTVVESADQNRVKEYDRLHRSQIKDDVKYKLNGSMQLGGQFHFTTELQTCYCVPVEDGMNMYPAAQGIYTVQRNAAVALDMPLNSINVSVKRLGGGFGCKEVLAALVSTACAVSAHKMRVPVRMAVKLQTSMEALGKRFPTYAKYDATVNDKGEIQSMDIHIYNDHGCVINSVPWEAVRKHISNCYDSSTWEVAVYHVITDSASNTFCRAPGSTEAIALVERIMNHIASLTGLDPTTVRIANLDSKISSALCPMIENFTRDVDFVDRKKSIDDFNEENRWKKRGISLVLMNFPLSAFGSYHVLMSVYSFDGSISISHGGIEMGQGLNTKVTQAVAYSLGVDINMIKIKASNVLTAPNNDATMASVATDGVTHAALECCKILISRLEPIKQKHPKEDWTNLIRLAASEKVDLCCESMYSPLASYSYKYNILGVTVSEVEVDVLTGQCQIRRVDILEDVGQSINPTIDIGQIEGAFVMGLGYWLTEQLSYDSNTGALLTNRAWTYTPPGAKDIPIDFRVYFSKNDSGPTGVLRSKAIGEPPLCMSVGVVYAIHNALSSARKDAGFGDNWFEIKLPCTPENVLLSAMSTDQQFVL